MESGARSRQMKSYRRQGLSWCQSRDPPWIIFGVFFCLTCSGSFLISDSPVNVEAVPLLRSSLKSRGIGDRPARADTTALSASKGVAEIYDAKAATTARTTAEEKRCGFK
ncbi:hypothetical protein P692DRAFT_20522587 [Suillus brevipes Sb2]|nr:hypothetical protein P692DRAFT_20522587 [Suillus brevipes Sb2]